MTGGPFRTTWLDDIEELDDGRCPWRPVRHHLGITAFGINAWTARAAGDRIINEHTEEGEGSDEELYLVLQGHAMFELDGDRLDAPAGTLVFARPGVKRTAFAEEAGTTILAIGGIPGEAYQPFGWEVWAPALPHYAAGDYERAIEATLPVIAENPDYPGPLYNLACCESLAGRPADAIEHLRRAIELAPRFRDHARRDTDFDPIRDEPAFVELLTRS